VYYNVLTGGSDVTRVMYDSTALAALELRACRQLRSGTVRGGMQESDLKQIFEPFGAVDYITLQHDGAGRSQGFGFVQCAPIGHGVALVL